MNSSNGAAPLLALSAASAAGMALLAQRLGAGGPTGLDRRVRRVAHGGQSHGSAAARALSPLFVLGLPGSYLAIAGATARALRRRGRAGGPAIVSSALAAWLGHRAIKVVYRRARPRIVGKRRRVDSYPSGHTTGATALALTTALVLAREGLLDRRAAAMLGLGAPLAMGAYRVLDDEHWATDVLGGWLLGAAIAASCAAIG